MTIVELKAITDHMHKIAALKSEIAALEVMIGTDRADEALRDAHINAQEAVQELLRLAEARLPVSDNGDV